MASSPYSFQPRTDEILLKWPMLSFISQIVRYFADLLGKLILGKLLIPESMALVAPSWSKNTRTRESNPIGFE